jgi:chaperonin GroES
MIRCRICQERATHCCVSLDASLHFCERHAQTHAKSCPDIVAGVAELAEMTAAYQPLLDKEIPMKTKLLPLHARVLVSRFEEEARTPGGLHIPAVAQEKPARGKVLAVGAGRVLDDGAVRPLDVKVGDVVLFAKYGGTEVEIDGEKLLILNEDDLLGVLA